MEKSTLKILISTIAITAGFGVAHAQDRGGEHQPMTFEAMDADGSGEITAEDLDMLREQRFAGLDADGDGSVSVDEFTAHAEARAAERATRMFDRLDVDGDGFLSRDVLETRMGRGPGARMLSRFDTDDSGGIDPEEFAAAQDRIAEHRGKSRDGKGRGWRRWHD